MITLEVDCLPTDIGLPFPNHQAACLIHARDYPSSMAYALSAVFQFCRVSK